jgi:hypothetical protein
MNIQRLVYHLRERLDAKDTRVTAIHRSLAMICTHNRNRLRKRSEYVSRGIAWIRRSEKKCSVIYWFPAIVNISNAGERITMRLHHCTRKSLYAREDRTKRMRQERMRFLILLAEGSHECLACVYRSCGVCRDELNVVLMTLG